MPDNRIILLADLIDQRLRKQQEIEFYEQELIKIQNKLSLLRREENLTSLILKMIQNEQIHDIKVYLEDKSE